MNPRRRLNLMDKLTGIIIDFSVPTCDWGLFVRDRMKDVFKPEKRYLKYKLYK